MLFLKVRVQSRDLSSLWVAYGGTSIRISWNVRAFLLERMHDDDMDLLRKRQILQALVDEFEDYETELGSASTSLDEAYGVPFFTAYGEGTAPFNTDSLWRDGDALPVWEAMLQSGGIEVLEVDVIQQVQVFLKSYRTCLICIPGLRGSRNK